MFGLGNLFKSSFLLALTLSFLMVTGCAAPLVIDAPQGAKVEVLDSLGNPVAVTPSGNSHTAPFLLAPYQIKVSKDGYADFETSFTAADFKTKGGKLLVELARKVLLSVKVAKPTSGYSVKVNGEAHDGNQVIYFGGDKVSEYKIEVTSPGYETFTTTLNEASYDKLGGGVLEVSLIRWLNLQIKTELGASKYNLQAPSNGKMEKSGDNWRLRFTKSQEIYTLSLSSPGFPNHIYRLTENTVADLNGKPFQASVIRKTKNFLFEYLPGKGMASRVIMHRSFPHGGKARRVSVLKDTIGVAGMAMRGDERVGFAKIELPDYLKKGFGILKNGEAGPMSLANVWEVTVLNGTLSRATGSNINIDPVYVPGSRPSILVSTNRWRRKTLDIVQVWLDGGAATRVVEDSRGWLATSPSIDPSGALAYCLIPTSTHVGNHPEIWFRPNARVRGNDTQLAKGYEPELDPGTGEWLVYVGLDKNLWKIRVDGTDLTQLTSNAEQIFEQTLAAIPEEERAIYQNNPQMIRPYRDPTWSPDGQFILFASMEGKDIVGRHNYDIWKLNSNGTGKAQLTTNGSSDMFPAVAPDNTPFFLSNRGAELGIYKLDVLE